MTERPEDNPPAVTPADGPGKARPRGRVALILTAAVILGAAAGLAGVYGIGGGQRNVVATAPMSADPSPGGDAACAAASETGRRIAGLATGELAAFAPTLKPTRIPDLAFLDPQGQETRLAAVGGDGLKLVNIWATWCVPCRKEMPALDELQRELGSQKGEGRDFEVVAINIDTRDPAKPRTFMEETGIHDLALYTDPKAQSFQDLRAVGRGFGLPTTMLIDAQGCEIGHIAGPAEWAGPDALALIRAALADGPQTP